MLMMPWLTFTSQNVINTTQHGFIKVRSVETNLLSFYNAISKSMESGTQTDVIYTDFSKAFDSVDHSLLLAKLHMYGVSDPLLSWFKSYLSDRTQQVKINDFLSDPFHASSGVPQGGHISPLLFAIFIIDIGTCFSYCDNLLFADDLKFFASFSSLVDSSLIQKDLDKLHGWCCDNGLKLNTSKCHKMSYTRYRNKIKYDYNILDDKLVEVDTIKDLGVTFQSNLYFSSHIENSSTKALKRLGFLTRCTKEFFEELCIKTLYICHKSDLS